MRAKVLACFCSRARAAAQAFFGKEATGKVEEAL
jgi:hypothetical protein